ncbi:phasin family protein [Paraburkholderia sediminicola]|uniref:phasin family protein n=1 Tax=Paraburkholderia sediminicola TaxID=458836 RepID=UPI0038BC9123
MSVFAPEQLAAAHRANVATLFTLTNQAFQGFQKLVDLNLQVVKSTLAEGEENWREALSGKTPMELLTRQASSAQPAGEKALAYTRHLYDIASGTQAEFAKVAQAQYEQQRSNTQTLVDNVVRSAPVGAEVMIAALKSAFLAADTAYETVRKAAEQAIEVAGNFAATAAAASKAGQQAAAQGPRAAKQG